MRILFMGTPDIAATCLTALLDAGHEVIGAVTQADRPKGRGYTLTPPPVKQTALSRGVSVYQPATLKDDAFFNLLTELAPEVIVVVAYGKILPASVLSYPKYGCINLHASLLPKYRGAAPIQRAIMDGETETGITTMYMDEGLDTGDMIHTERITIGPRDNFETIHDRMAELGGKLLLRTLSALADGSAVRIRQDGTQATYAKKIEKEDCRLDFTRAASELDPFIRGLSPIPLALCRHPDGKMLKIVRAEPTDGQGAPGEVLSVSDRGEGGITVACGESALIIRELVPEGKGRRTAADFVRGRGIKEGDILA